jgi:hypothetical protein
MTNEATTSGVSRTEFVESTVTRTSPAFGQTPSHVLGPAAASAFLPFLLALGSLTSGITYAGEPPTPARYGTYSVLSPYRRRRGQLVTLRQAREIALEVLRQANQELIQERQTEAHFILRSWDEQDD